MDHPPIGPPIMSLERDDQKRQGFQGQTHRVNDQRMRCYTNITEDTRSKRRANDSGQEAKLM